ncbi:MAG: type II secretion system F family protein [Candidatus Micrarchaeota archaeon]
MVKSKNWLNDNYEKLLDYYAATGFKFPFQVFVGVFLLVAILVFFVLFMLKLPIIINVIAFLSIMSLVIAVPISIRNARISHIDENLPDSLKHMALVLRAGGTTETALQEVSEADYGPLSVELGIALIRMREGQSFDDVLNEAARRSGSKLFTRVAIIIIDAKKAGAGLADVMFAIAEDARDVLHIKRERQSRTVMHVLFLVTSGVLLSPFIFGFAISIVHYISTGISGSMPGAVEVMSLCTLNLILTGFIVIETVLASIAIGIIREGKPSKFILYTPLMILAALLIFEIGKWLSTAIVGGQSFVC